MSGTSSIANTINSSLRTTGLSSGLDTDTLVKKLVTLESSKVDKAKQNRQLTQWKQGAYRDIISSLQGFYSTYFDILSPTNITSASAFTAYKATYNGSDTSAYITIKPGAGAQTGNYVIKNIQTAKNAQATGATLSSASGIITGGYIKNSDITNISSSNNNNKISVNFNGTNQVITLKDNPVDLADLKSDLQSKLDSAFGSGKITVGTAGTDANGGELTFATSTTNAFSIASVTENSTLNAGFSTLGLTGVNTSNKIGLTATLSDIEGNFSTALVPAAGGGNDIKFTINGQQFAFNSTTTNLSSIMTAVSSNTAAGVTMSYDQLTDKISIKSNNAGAAASIQITDDSGNLMTTLGLNGVKQSGSDASMDLSTDGGTTFQTIARSSNSFTINNVNYTLNSDTTTSVNVSVTADASKIVDLVKGFVSKYNDILNTINTKLSEQKDKNYPPLTDAQKSAMSSTDIASWEAKAKVGLLEDDDVLQGIVDNMRTAMYSSVSGVSATLTSIGITTGVYTDKGKLTIDETKLSAAVNNNPDQVIQLFTQTSQYSYSEAMTDPAKKSTRYTEAGLGYKLGDILQDNIRTMRYSSDQKGTLLEKAGLVGDTSEYINLMTKELNDDDTEINDLTTKLSDKETFWYNKFSAMETALNSMNQQSAWISQQFGGSSGG